jgi:hypothetical protein
VCPSHHLLQLDIRKLLDELAKRFEVCVRLNLTNEKKKVGFQPTRACCGDELFRTLLNQLADEFPHLTPESLCREPHGDLPHFRR